MKFLTKTRWAALLLATLPAILNAQAPGPEKTPEPDAKNQAIIQLKPEELIIKLRQLGLALLEFDTEYGEYPCIGSIESVREATETKMKLGTKDSGDFFDQLVAAGMLNDRTIFTFPDPKAPKDAEGNPATTTFSYISGASSANHPSCPLAVHPLINGKMIFDREAMGGKAVILFIDCSARTFPIEADGTVKLDGKDLFDPTQPYWGSREITVKWPKLTKPANPVKAP